MCLHSQVIQVLAFAHFLCGTKLNPERRGFRNEIMLPFEPVPVNHERLLRPQKQHERTLSRELGVSKELQMVSEIKFQGNLNFTFRPSLIGPAFMP